MPIFDYNFNKSDSTLRLISGINICDEYKKLEINTNRHRRNHFFIGVVITSCTYRSDHLDQNNGCSNTVRFWQNAWFATMQFFVFENSRAIMATEDQVYITRFLYSFTKDNLARYTKKCSRTQRLTTHNTCTCASL